MSVFSPIQTGEHAASQSARRLLLPLDPLLTLAVLGLGACSVLTLKATTAKMVPGNPSYYYSRQVIYLGIGVAAMLVLSRIDYARLRRFKLGIYALLLLSILAVLAAGHSSNGSQRAISLPFFSFQGSELGKVLLIVALSAFLVERARRLRERQTTALLLLGALIPAMLVIAQPDLGSGLVYMSIAYMLLVIVGTSWRQLTGIALVVVCAITLVLVVAPAVGVHPLQHYQSERLTAFLHPSSNPKDKGAYQLHQSEIAIGSGQKTGAHTSEGQVASGYVPEGNTDFIFAAVGEQYGFAGAALVLVLYGLLLSRTLRILVMAKDLFGSLIAAGVAAMLMFQVFVNVGVTVGIMPITGVTLPLMSYGGSSVITIMLGVGLLQSIYVQARASAASKRRVAR